MKVVMVDQDGVMYDRNYKTTADLGSIIRRIVFSDIMLAPNSDTPVRRLLKNAKGVFGFYPIVAIGEKGSIVRILGKDVFLCGIKGIKNFVDQIAKTLSDFGAACVIGDSATWIRNRKRFEPNKDLLIIDGLRQQSVGFYLRTSDSQGIAQINHEWAEQASKIVMETNLPDGLGELGYNPNYGIFISNPKGSNKTLGYAFLKQEHPECSFFMIGDADIDIIEDDSVIHCAVGNATQPLKQKAAFVSDKPFTEGLEDCLRWIMGCGL